MLQIKPGAKVNGLRPEILLAVIVADGIYEQYSVKCVITEGTGGKHREASLHYVGNAVDLRTKSLPSHLIEPVAQQIRVALGEQYDVVVEKDHIHMEYQPK